MEREYCPSRRYYMSDLLDEKTLYQQGCYRRVKRWHKGWRSRSGVRIKGWRGRETVREEDSVRPIRSFTVK